MAGIKGEKAKKEQEKRRERTRVRTEYLRQENWNVVQIYECEYHQQYLNIEAGLLGLTEKYLPPFCKSHANTTLSRSDLLKAVTDDSLFGMVECDLHVPENWSAGHEKEITPKEYFSEMSPLFCTMDVPYDVIGDHMQAYVEEMKLGKEPRRVLVGGMSARKILLATPLLKWYLSHGLVLTHIYKVLEFVPKACFSSFEQDVTQARRRGDQDKTKKIIGDTMKLIGNSGKLVDENRTIMLNSTT
jgi:hypothetical protein